ncbi:MAG: BREX-1 system phosphatase PglZ type B [Rubrobacter sp.]|nr:BREX-1 system phosphatase PglZ type B [Rubrobacter sp.]MDQ3315914.1 BREX-1 system phosphatase PglZ type B [Actinomycetota bacterium]
MKSAKTVPRNTVREALVAALRSASEHNRSDVVAPETVLWTDRERRWEPVIPLLREEIPLLTLGPYGPETLTGPAIWLRCALAGTLPEIDLPGGTPVVYLPGVGRSDLRAVEDCPKPLQPLAELQYRGVIFSHPNGRDWTPAAFLAKGFGIEVVGGPKTQSALARALPALLERSLAELKEGSPLQAADLDELLVPDPGRELLVWLDDPGAYGKVRGPEALAAFADICNARYGFDPASDGELEAARRLTGGVGPWKQVWGRYAEAPRRYPNLPSLLDRVEPAAGMKLFEETSPYRPQDNRAEEDRLREALLALQTRNTPDARARIAGLEAHHGERRQWVWAELGQSPLAGALSHLASLAQATADPPVAGTAWEIAEGHVAGGWKVDAEAMSALASVHTGQDVAAVRAAVRSVYADWLEECARRFQQAVAAGPPPESVSLDPDGPQPGVCTLFTDGLRLDLAHRLSGILADHEAEAQIAWRFAALPGVTPTAKPVLTPLGPELHPGNGFGAEVNGSKVTAQSLRKMLGERGYQILATDEVGNPLSTPSGSSWTESGDLDALGHARGSGLAREAENSLKALAERVKALLDAGWREVRVVTDHGWLLLPGGLTKTELPEHLTEVRKGRCARLKPGASTDQQTIPWSLDAGVSVAVAPGASAYEAGKEYEHGGLSPQECVVPVLTVVSSAPASAASISEIRWVGMRCRVKVEGAPDGATVGLRTRAADPSTSVATARPLKDGTASLLVTDDSREFEAAISVVLDAEGRVLAQSPTVVGG